MRAITLGYHAVFAEGSGMAPVRRRSNYTIAHQDFIEQLARIRERVDPHRIKRVTDAGCSTGPDPVFLTFDDGTLCQGSPAAGDLEKFGWRGHIFVVSGWVGNPGFLGADEIRNLSERGHVIGSHSKSHPERMSHLSDEELKREWRDSCEALSSILGKRVRVASVAGGYYSRRVAQAAARQGISFLFTSEPTAAVTDVDACLVLGRYSVRRGMTADAVAAIAAGDRIPRLKQSAAWAAKTPAKKLTGGLFPDIRRALLRLNS